jgi:hypothetical protein
MELDLQLWQAIVDDHVPPALLLESLIQSQLDDERLICEASLYEYLIRAWPQFDPATFAANWHIRVICEHLEAVSYGEIRRLIINIPPRMMKTSIVSIAWPTWTWARMADVERPLLGPGVRFLCASYGAKKAEEDAVTARRLIASPWYQRLWGDRLVIAKDRDNAGQYDTTAGGSRISTGIPESLGKGGIIRILDDPHKTTEIESQAVVESQVRAYNEVWRTRSNDPNQGAEVLIMQRQAEADLSGYLLDNEGGEIVHLFLPAEFESGRRCVTAGRPPMSLVILGRRMGSRCGRSGLTRIGVVGSSVRLGRLLGPVSFSSAQHRAGVELFGGSGGRLGLRRVRRSGIVGRCWTRCLVSRGM